MVDFDWNGRVGVAANLFCSSGVKADVCWNTGKLRRNSDVNLQFCLNELILFIEKLLLFPNNGFWLLGVFPYFIMKTTEY